MATLLNSTELKTGGTLGDVSASSLVKSASTLTNELNTYDDAYQKQQFDNDPTPENLQAYTQYLNGRISTLTLPGNSITDQTKAITLQNEAQSAITTSTTFSIDQISANIMAGTGTDQDKLNYLQGVLSNPAVQADPDMYEKYQNQAYNLQQSIGLQAQSDATAAQTAYNTDEAAAKKGYDNTIDAFDKSWQTIVDNFKNGDAKDVQTGLKTFAQEQGPTLKAMGISLPASATLTMAGAAQAMALGEVEYYMNAAKAVGSMSNPNGSTDNRDADAYVQKAQDIINGVTTFSTPAGSMTLAEIDKWSAEPTNAYAISTNVNGDNTMKQNAVTGYKMEKGQIIPNSVASSLGLANAPTTESAVPTSDGSNVSTYERQGVNQSAIQSQLKNLGFAGTGTSSKTIGTTDGNLSVRITNKAAQSLGNKYDAKTGTWSIPDLAPGNDVTMVVTNGGKGYQFESSEGNVYGISTNSNGQIGLYTENAGNGWNFVSGAKNTVPSLKAAPPMGPTQIPNVQRATIAQKTNSTISSITNQSPLAMSQRAGGGFDFTYNGKAISAATYSILSGVQFRTLLSTMASKGDAGAQTVLGFVGNNYGADPTKLNSSNAGLYNDMVWGSTAQQSNLGAKVNLPSIPGLKL